MYRSHFHHIVQNVCLDVSFASFSSMITLMILYIILSRVRDTLVSFQICRHFPKNMHSMSDFFYSWAINNDDYTKFDKLLFLIQIW